MQRYAYSQLTMCVLKELHTAKHGVMLNDSAQILHEFRSKLRDDAGRPLYMTKQNMTDRYGTPAKERIGVFERLNAMYTDEQVSRRARQRAHDLCVRGRAAAVRSY